MSEPSTGQLRSVTVSIAGERHVLRSDAEPEYTVRVAQHVDSTMRALGSAQPLEPHRTAILAALSITDELFRVREELRLLRATAESHAGRLATQLSSVVDGADQGTRPASRVRKKGG
jgi:cell division protein ZapA